MNPPPLILPLAEANASAVAGGKAINLARMLQAGLPVPNGFVVTTAAYHDANGDLSSLPRLADSIRDAYIAMGSPLVAVRSSATAEDMAGASMAGQYETYLNCATPEAVVEAVGKCWVSIQAPRIQSYLKQQQIDPALVAMAVVVQRQVAADKAGVLFTANPQTGATNEFLIEAAWGLGESIVSGEVQPDRIRVDAHQGEVLDYVTSKKTHQVLPGAAGIRKVPEAVAAKACIQYEEIQELFRLAHKVVRHFKTPQDLEWAIEGDDVFLLQTRPITTLEEARAYRECLDDLRSTLGTQTAQPGYGPWVRHNLGETLTHPSPLTWALVSRFMSGSGGYGLMYRDLGFVPSDRVSREGFLELIGGSIYMDCARMPEMFREDYPFLYDLDLLRTDPEAAQAPPTLPSGSYGRQAAAARLNRAAGEKLKSMAVDLDTHFAETFMPEVHAWAHLAEQQDLTQLDDPALENLWEAQRETILDRFGATAFLPSLVEIMARAELRAFLDEHLWDDCPDTLLQKLSVSAQPDSTMISNIHLQEVANGQRTLVDWLAEHGHRAPGEFDLAVPRWRERPDALQGLIDSLKDSPNLQTMHEQRLQQAEDTLNRLALQLTPEQAAELRRRTQLVQRYLRFREDGKATLMRAYAVLRRTTLEIAGRLGMGEDLFFLRPMELFDALSTGYIPRDLIRRRQLRYGAEKRLHLPPIIAEEDLDVLGEVDTRIGDGERSAHPISPGIGAGPARIVLSPETAGNLGKDYILVCPSTDPSWAPLFVNAAGLVLERGGALSHGAVVARELGLPAVVLDGATRLFTDGEPIRINGNHGRILPLTDENAEDADAGAGDANDLHIDRSDMPPPVSAREVSGTRLALISMLVWGLFLAAVFLLPEAWLKTPVWSGMDALLWPLIPAFGMIATVAIVAVVFSGLIIVGQRLFTDNARLMEARLRANRLRKAATQLPPDSPRRTKLERLGTPVTTRVLKASLVPLALLFGPMIMIFLWFPERVDPAVWNADPIGIITIIAHLKGDLEIPVSIDVPESFELDAISPREQTLSPVYAELLTLRREMLSESDLGEYPMELQIAARATREMLLASLNNHLKNMPPKKLLWRLRVPESADGLYRVPIRIGKDEVGHANLVFGRQHPPESAHELSSENSGLMDCEVIYPRPQYQRSFWTPLKAVGGPSWDFGWLSIYVLFYVAGMLAFKKALRVP